MIEKEYPAANSEQTIFIKWDGADFIIHGLVVDDMQSESTSQNLMGEFLAAHGRDFEITGGDVMSTFMGLQVDHVNQEIHLHMDNYVEEILREYKEYARSRVTEDSTPHEVADGPNHQVAPAAQDASTPGPSTGAADYVLLPVVRDEASVCCDCGGSATWVRFDISFTVSQLASHMSSPGQPHWSALHHLMEYLSTQASGWSTGGAPGLTGSSRHMWIQTGERRSRCASPYQDRLPYLAWHPSLGSPRSSRRKSKKQELLGSPRSSSLIG
jgi:hypothetical protein